MAHKYERWSPEEIEAILEAMRRGEFARHLYGTLPGRTARAIDTRYQMLKREYPDLQPPPRQLVIPPELPPPPPPPAPKFKLAPREGGGLQKWTPQEKELLTDARERGLNWTEITHWFPGRSHRSVKNRWHRGEGSPPRTYGRWTEEEDAIIEKALAEGLKQAAIVEIIPNRNANQVQNRIRTIRCRQQATCFQCGGPNNTGNNVCPDCREDRRLRGATRYNNLRAQGICTMCGVRPADASLTLCEVCLVKNRACSPKPPISRSRQPHQGLIRWIGSPALGPHINRFPKGVKVVDLFGGSGAYAVRAVEEGHDVVVYNDIHPGLVAFMRAFKAGQAKAVWRLCRDLAKKTPDELASLYRRATTLHREGLAAVTYTLARSIPDKNLRNIKIDEVFGPPSWSGMSVVARRATRAFAKVEITNLDYLEAIEALDSPDTFFCDPPYPRTAKFEHNLTGRHDELMERLHRIQGRFLLVFGSSRRAAEIMREAPYVYRETCRRGPLKVRELLATNYELDSEPLDFAAFGM